jgi:hypothetical protein
MPTLVQFSFTMLINHVCSLLVSALMAYRTAISRALSHLPHTAGAKP